VTTFSVTPFTGVWIEIPVDDEQDPPGLPVTPFTGVWIEIRISSSSMVLIRVTPFTGVWIEMYIKSGAITWKK